MFITKFNRLIRSKILWWVITIIVIVAFVGAYSSYRTAGCGSSEEDNVRYFAGRLNGRNITHAEFELARKYTVGFKEPESIETEDRNIIREQTWKRFVALEKADKLNIPVVDDKEIARIIESEPNFQVDGRFSKELFLRFINYLGIPLEIYTDYIKQQVRLFKLQNILETFIWIPLKEIEEHAGRLTEILVMEYAEWSISNKVYNIEVTDEELEAYYNAYKENFAEPEKRKTVYVNWSISNAMADINVNMDEIGEYYTNVVLGTLEGTNVPPLEIAMTNIYETLRYSKALERVNDMAMEFVVKMIRRKGKENISFEKLAEEMKLTVYTTELFSINDRVSGIDITAPFSSAVFALESESEVTDPIVGTNEVYVAQYISTVPARIPEFHEIKERVKMSYIEDRRKNLFMEEMKKIREEISKGMAEKPFMELVKPFMPVVVTSLTFSAYSVFTSQNIPHRAFDILSGILYLPANNLSEVIDFSSGAIIVYLKERHAGDTDKLMEVMRLLRDEMISFRRSLLIKEWQKFILAESNLKDYVLEFEKKGDYRK